MFGKRYKSHVQTDINQIEQLPQQVNSPLLNKLRSDVLETLGQNILKDFNGHVDIDHLKLFLEHTERR